VIFSTTAPDAVGYSGSPPSSPASGCITPPPFGEQCTMLADVALRTCLALPGCTSLTCPDPAPYTQPHPKIPRTGPVCQARSVRSAASWAQGEALEAGHGMCAPSGCTSFFIARLAPSDVARVVLERLGVALAAAHARSGGAPPTRPSKLLAWGSASGVPPAARQLLAADGLVELTQLFPPPGSVGGAWLLGKAAHSSTPLLREQLGGEGSGSWAALTDKLEVYILPS
jgi:hypothetical protein